MHKKALDDDDFDLDATDNAPFRKTMTIDTTKESCKNESL